MGLTLDLIDQAKQLATYQGTKATQASLRRAVSTAYYALFHLLTQDAASRWPGAAETRTAIERGFRHSLMKSVSRGFQKPQWKDHHGAFRQIPPELRSVAGAFGDLQEKRPTADYDNHHAWSPSDVREIVSRAEEACQAWHLTREDPMAGNYLIAMLLGK